MRQLKLTVLSCLLAALQLTSGHYLQQRNAYDFDASDELSAGITDWPSDAPATDAEGYQTFTRDGATLRVKPQQQMIRIGGSNVPPEQMIRQAELMKGLEPVAVRQLLKTKQPVMRTTFENDQKRTSTYTLEPDGSILCKTVEDVDPKMVDAEFEKLFQRRKQQQQQQSESRSKSQPNWEWASAPSAPKPYWLPQQPTTSTPTPAPIHTNSYPQLPQTWNTRTWPQHDPFNPAELPPMPGNSYADPDFDDPFFHASPFPSSYDTQAPKKVSTTTTTDKDGNTVQTTYSMGPNEWKRKTVKITTQHIPPYSPTTSTSTSSTSTISATSTTPRLPSLEEFLRAQYEATSTTPRPFISSYDPLRTTTIRTPSVEKPVTQLNINDLPLMAVLNNGQPLDEHYLRTYPTELQPLTGDNRQPIKTINIQDIPPTPEKVETTKVRTVTKTLHSDALPTAADLDPNMLAMLERAGIKPEDIIAAHGNAITKTRVEPDGRVVKTTYRVRLMPAGENTEQPNHQPASPFESNNPPPLFKPWQPPNSEPQSNMRPAYFSEKTPVHHYSSSRSGVQFVAPPSISTSSTTTSTSTTTTIKPPQEREREPLEPAITLNPMHIHPIQHHQPPIALPAASATHGLENPIADFLAKIGLTMNDILMQNGELVKAIANPDGRVLTVKFMFSAPPAAPQK